MGARARLGTAGGLRREGGRPLSLPPSEVGDPPSLLSSSLPLISPLRKCGPEERGRECECEWGGREE